MERVMGQYSVLVASDIVRDGLGVELWDNEHNLVVEVFRCDANNTVLLNTFNNDVPLNVLQSLIQFARERLEPFEDGSPLPEADSVTLNLVVKYS
jgi:hypothetical protein